MNYYKVTFNDSSSYIIHTDLTAHQFLRHIRRFVSSYTFNKITYLNHPIKFEQVETNENSLSLKDVTTEVVEK